MKKYQHRFYIIAISLLMISLVLVFSSCGKRIIADEIYDELTKGNVADDLTLIIYYCDPYTLYYFPMTIEDISTDGYDGKIIVCSDDLKEHSDVFKLLNSEERVCDKELDYEDVRVYFILKSQKAGTIIQGVDQAVNGYFIPESRKITTDFYKELENTFLIPNIDDERIRSNFLGYFE